MSKQHGMKSWMRRTEWALAWVGLASALTLSGCGGGAADGNVSDETVDLGLYAPQNLPSNFTVEVPDSLSQDQGSTDGGGTGRILASRTEHLTRLKEVAQAARVFSKDAKITGRVGKANRPPVHNSKVKFNRRGIQTDDYGYTAMGYYELENVISQMDMKKQDVAMNFLMADAIFDQVVAYCATDGQDPSSSCSIPADALTLTFTEEMVNFILGSMGVSTDDPYYADYAAMYQEMIGMEMPVPALSYTTSAPGGYDHQIIFDNGSWEDYQSGTTLSWDAARTKVQLVYSYSSPDWGSGSDSYTYSDTDKMVTYANSGEYSGTSWTYSMTMQEDPSKADAHGVLFTVRTEYQGGSDHYVMNLSGVADDDGGYVETTQTTSYTEVSLTSGANYLSDQGYYVIVPGPDCSEASWQSAIGTISVYDQGTYDEYWNYVPGDGVISSDEVYPYVWGSTDLLSGSYSVCEYGYEWSDLDYNYVESFTAIPGVSAGDIVLSAGDPVTYVWKYSEGFDGDGMLNFSAYASCDEFGNCDTYTYDLGSSSEAESYEYTSYYDDATEDGAIIDDIPVVTLTGDTSSITTDSYIVFTRDGMEIDDYWTNVIGYAYFNYWGGTCDEYGNCSGAWETYYWGTSDEWDLADAYIYEYSYDESTGYSWTYTPTSAYGLAEQ